MFGLIKINVIVKYLFIQKKMFPLYLLKEHQLLKIILIQYSYF